MSLPSIPDVVSLDRGPDGQVQREHRVHCFDDPQDDARQALYAAIGANRPLLVRGEPGVGKTQLAEAAAIALGRLFLTVTVDSRTESRDLLYSFDTVRRLAEAQLQAALPAADDEMVARRRADLDADRFLVPGRLWWTFDSNSARNQARRAGVPEEYTIDHWGATRGVVLLIDEIDKAEPDVPNGLLEALGSRQFHPPCGLPAVRQQGEPPLIIITTNEERALPDPFLRRCVVLVLRLPGDDRDPQNPQLLKLLRDRGKAHFPGVDFGADGILHLAAEQVIRDRSRAALRGQSLLPGQAEYLDLVRAALASAPGDPDRQRKNLQRFAKFILEKQGQS